MSTSGPVQAGPEWTRLGFEENWRENWTEVTFPDKKPTTYTYDTATQSVCARANQSASAWVRSLSGRDTVPSKLRWEWRVDTVLSEGNALKKSGDDYAARVYVNFEAVESLSYWDRMKLKTFETIYGQDIPSRSVNFIWSNRLDRGTILPSPYTKYTRLVALRNHESPTGTWQRETVDLKKYYRRIFDEEYIRPHSVSIMTDTDDTESTVRGCYRNLAVQ
jgi:hypothetical protein